MIPKHFFQPLIPHFFQPLLPGFELQFSIPEAFYKNYFNGGGKKKKGGGGGGERTVVLRTRKGKVYEVKVRGKEFKDGWKEFVEEHDLHVGDFLVFRLDGEMAFHVMVFDPTVCERQYNVAPAKQNQVPAAVVEEVQTSAVEEETSNGDFWVETPREKNVGDKASLGAAEAGKPCFDFTARTDFISKHRVHIPMKFAGENGLVGKHCETIVMDEEGRAWPARLVSYPSSACAVQLGRSWRGFQMKNVMELGDSLKFELVRGGMKPVFRMSGFGMRRMEKGPVHEASPAAAAAVSSRDSLDVEAVRGLKPAFKVIELDPTPKKRTKEIVKEVKQEPVHEESSAAAAAAESSKDGNSYFTVNLTGELDPNPKTDTMEIETVVKQEPVHEEAAVPSKVEDPYFTARLTEGYLKGGFLNIPPNFAIKNGLHGISLSLMLANQMGTTFLVGLKTSKAGRPYIGSGWREVVEINKFRMGDVLRFDLVESGSNPVMNFKVVPTDQAGSSVN